MNSCNIKDVKVGQSDNKKFLLSSSAGRQKVFYPVYLFVKTSQILTESVKDALCEYLDTSIENYMYRRKWFSDDRFMEMVQELLETICNKPLNSITYDDVVEYEGDICTSVYSVLRFNIKNTLYLDIVDYCSKILDKKHMRKSLEFDSIEKEKYVKGLSEMYKRKDKRVIAIFKEFGKNG